MDGRWWGAVGRLAPVVPFALVIGVASSLVLLVVSAVAGLLQRAAWQTLPRAFGLAGTSPEWIIAVLLACGLLTGLVVWLVPGHAGPDPATEGLIAAPMPLRMVPSLLVAVVLTLAGGVSLGPENPITAANIALAFAFGRWVRPSAPAPLWVGLGAAGTVGALFGTPVAAALMLSESADDPDTPLWDRMFGPLIAAGAGAITTVSLAQPLLSVRLPAYRGFALVDVGTAALIALAGGGLGLLAIYAFPWTHRVFHLIRNPVPMLLAGGLILGVLGAIGGHLTLFKGLDEMKELTAHATAYGPGQLALFTITKLVALVIAGTCGFRGGRIFPAVFAGVALGLLATSLFPAIPAAVSVSAAILGLLVAVTRQGWLSLFMAVTTVADIRLLPILCIAVLPVWLLCDGRPPMLVTKPPREAMPEPS